MIFRRRRNWLGERPAQEVERRLSACEAHLSDLEERMTEYGYALSQCHAKLFRVSLEEPEPE